MTTTGVLTLTEFLLARIAEDEVVARDVWTPGEWFDDAAVEHSAYSVVMSPVEGRVARCTDRGNAAHIARHDPVRVLAECEAKRRIVGLHEAYTYEAQGPIPDCATCGCADCAPRAARWPCPTLRALAFPYADHPDFREEWTP